MKSLAAVKRVTVDVIRVFPSPGDRRRGRIRAGSIEIPCALGRSGPVRRKREGDGGTPVARMGPLGALYRPDRMPRPPLRMALKRMRQTDGWCDDPGARRYNRPVVLPVAASHERMWRDDGLYDLVVDLGWNRRPVIKGRGSAIFLHAARPGLAPTEGCVAVDRRWLVRFARLIGRRTVIEVRG